MIREICPTTRNYYTTLHTKQVKTYAINALGVSESVCVQKGCTWINILIHKEKEGEREREREREGGEEEE